MSELPHGWANCLLGDLAAYVTSGSRDWSKYYSTSGALFVRTENINKNRLGSLTEIARVALPDSVEGKRTRIKRDDLLITITGANVGKCAHIDLDIPEAYVSQSVALVRLIDETIAKFIQRQLIAPSPSGDKTLLQESAYGLGRPVLNLSNVREISIALAPFNEQKRIADKLDAVLARVDACRNRLDRIPDILKRFRQSVLAAATSGKLTEDWRDENAYLLDDWTTNLLGSLVKASANGLSKRRGDVGNETVVLRLADFKKSERVQGNERTIKLDGKELEKYSLTTGDLLVVRVNGSRDLAGKFIIYESRGEEAEAYCDHFIRLRLDRQLIAPQFALFVANSGTGRHYVESVLLTTAGQNTINQTALFGLNIRLPPLAEQAEIVRRVEELFACADRLEIRYAAARAQVEKLTPATLVKAFRGELVPQDPNDEPASKLLERISLK